MEKQLFDWKEYDYADGMIFVFGKITLKKDIGNLKAGSKFLFANLNFENGDLEFGNEDVEHSFELELAVVKQTK